MTSYAPKGDWRIRINGNEHGTPHVHVEFRDGSRVSVSIGDRRMLAGSVLPAKRLKPALEDIRTNARAYLKEYQRLNP